RLVKDNLKVGVELLVGHLRRPDSSVQDLAPGECGLVKVEGQIVGAYRDPAGQLHAVSSNCTHLGCRLRWNSAEISWDCHCHGSRFDRDGSVLNGPAVQPLERINVAADDEDPVPGGGVQLVSTKASAPVALSGCCTPGQSPQVFL